MHLFHNCQKQILNQQTGKDWHDNLYWSYMQGDQTKTDACPPLAVLNYTLNKPVFPIKVHVALPLMEPSLMLLGHTGMEGHEHATEHTFC